MIETLNGICETVNCKQGTSLKLHDNREYENYPAHWHTAMEIILPLDNCYTVETPERSFILRENDIIVMCPGCIHTLYAPPTGRRLIFQPDISALRFLSDVEGLITAMSPYIVISPEEYPELHEQMRTLLLNITEEYKTSPAFSEVSIYAKVLQMLCLIGRYYSNEGKSNLVRDKAKQEEYFDKFNKICDYINEHCSEELTLEAIADMSGFSKFYFSKLFKQFTNVSFYRYVNQKRIAMAEMLLINPENSITDVALSCGFSSLSPFIRMFKLIKGCTPTEFRNIYK